MASHCVNTRAARKRALQAENIAEDNNHVSREQGTNGARPKKDDIATDSDSATIQSTDIESSSSTAPSTAPKDNENEKKKKREKPKEKFTPAIPYDSISKNVFPEKSENDKKKNKKNKKSEIEVCECSKTLGKNCLDKDCSNWNSQTECSKNSCSKFCENQRFSKRVYCKVVGAHINEMKGDGLLAGEDIPEGKFVMEYIGEVIEAANLGEKKEKYKGRDCKHFYFFKSEKYIIDATKMGNLSRLINHSCDPNVVVEKWIVPGTPLGVERLGLFAIRPIKKGEELFFDYGSTNEEDDHQKCFCKAKNCKGYVGRPPKQVKKAMEVSDDVPMLPLTMSPLQPSTSQNFRGKRPRSPSPAAYQSGSSEQGFSHSHLHHKRTRSQRSAPPPPPPASPSASSLQLPSSHPENVIEEQALANGNQELTKLVDEMLERLLDNYALQSKLARGLICQMLADKFVRSQNMPVSFICNQDVKHKATIYLRNIIEEKQNDNRMRQKRIANRGKQH